MYALVQLHALRSKVYASSLSSLPLLPSSSPSSPFPPSLPLSPQSNIMYTLLPIHALIRPPPPMRFAESTAMLAASIMTSTIIVNLLCPFSCWFVFLHHPTSRVMPTSLQWLSSTTPTLSYAWQRPWMSSFLHSSFTTFLKNEDENSQFILPWLKGIVNCIIWISWTII